MSLPSTPPSPPPQRAWGRHRAPSTGGTGLEPTHLKSRGWGFSLVIWDTTFVRVTLLLPWTHISKTELRTHLRVTFLLTRKTGKQSDSLLRLLGGISEERLPAARAVGSLETFLLRCASELTRCWKRPRVLPGNLRRAAEEPAAGRLSKGHHVESPVCVLPPFSELERSPPETLADGPL